MLFLENGPWCWIRNLNDDCSKNNRGFWEQIGLWYILINLVCFVLVVLPSWFADLEEYNPRTHLILKYLKEVQILKLLKFVLLLMFMVVYETLFVLELAYHNAALNERA